METTNNIRFNAVTTDNEGNHLYIAIRLNDECKNGHNDFSITGNVYQKDKPKLDRYNIRGGAMGDDIAKWHPEYKIFNDLHLCDAKGAPMYAQSNGFYHLKNSSKETVISYLRITEEEYTTLSIAEDEKYFTYLLDNVLHIPARWEKEALEAIQLLEDWTGLKFKDDSTRYQFTPLSEEVAIDVKEKIANGYYSAEEITKRTEQKTADKKQALIKSLTDDRDKSIKKANDEFNVKIHILNSGLPINNFIYYNHTNTGVFNWKDYESKITPEQLSAFQELGTPDNLPAGIIFKLAK